VELCDFEYFESAVVELLRVAKQVIVAHYLCLELDVLVVVVGIEYVVVFVVVGVALIVFDDDQLHLCLADVFYNLNFPVYQNLY